MAAPSVKLEFIVSLRIPAALGLAIVASAPLFAQPHPLSLCIVQTKSTAARQYDPSAGPFAIAMYKSLSGRTLQNGTPLAITVLAASVQKDVLLEVRRLNCAWVLQLWHHRNADDDEYGGAMPGDLAEENAAGAVNSLEESDPLTPRSIGDQNSLIFTVWNGATQKVLTRGAGPLNWPTPPAGMGPNAPSRNPYMAFSKQILKKLNQLP
jgi:hypothetical protein